MSHFDLPKGLKQNRLRIEAGTSVRPFVRQSRRKFQLLNVIHHMRSPLLEKLQLKVTRVQGMPHSYLVLSTELVKLATHAFSYGCSQGNADWI